MKKVCCILAALLLLCSLPTVVTVAAEPDGTLTVASATAKCEEQVTVSLTLAGCRTLKSMMLKGLSYDSTSLELVSGSWKVEEAAIEYNALADGKVASMAMSANTDLNGVVYELTFRVKSTAEFTEYPIGITVIANYMDTDKADKPVTLAVTAGKITVVPQAGDVNADGVVNSDDAIYLLNYTLAPASFPITGDCDFDGDEVVTSNDAIYLLNYTLNAEDYPLVKKE